MIADAVPWKFRAWGSLDPERRTRLIAAGQKYLTWTITHHKPSLVVAMGGDSRRAMALLSGLGEMETVQFATGACTEERRARINDTTFSLIGAAHPSAQYGAWERAEPVLTESLRQWFRSRRPAGPPAVIRRRPAD